MATPRWVPRLALDAALARAPQKYHYEPDSDLATLASAYAFGLAKARPYHDGNKRAALLAATIFLGLNGKDPTLPKPRLCKWSAHSRPVPSPKSRWPRGCAGN